ncbi:hypothetical protein HK104_002312 [Borealophlyctis nickersoniae]|nr:hypothetical protein HK104_002312 [Borealophlyctis nickersoniae]
MPYTLNTPYITLLRNDGQNLLQVFPVGTLSTSYVRLTAGSGSKGRIAVNNGVIDYWDMDSTGITTTSPFAISNTTDSTSAATGALTVSGGVGIAKSLKVGTTITCVSLSQTSDRNLKNEIEPLSDSSLNFIMSLKPVSYKFKTDPKKSKSMGLIAQDVEMSCRTHGLPSDLVKIDDKKTYGLEYAQLMAPLIGAVQELNKSIENLRERIEKVERFTIHSYFR